MTLLKLRDCWIMATLLAMALPCTAFAAADVPAPALSRQLLVNQARYGIAGQAALVAHNDKVLFRGVAGKADLVANKPVHADTVFPVYSLAKLFTSILVMQLVEQGEVELHKPVGDYVPGLPRVWQSMPVHHFLDHTSGIPEYFGDMYGPAPFAPTLDAALAALADTPLQFASGTATRYTQTNYLVLTALLERHYGKPYAALAHERIVQKLRLQRTWFGKAGVPTNLLARVYSGNNGKLAPSKEVPWPPYSYGHAELYSTVDDLATFLQAVRGGALVGRATLEGLWQPQTLADGQRGVFASGWEYGDSGRYRHVGHDGGAQVRVRFAFRDTPGGDAYIFIYLTNGSERNVWSRTLINSLMAKVAPQSFASEALTAQLIDYATQSGRSGNALALAARIRQRTALHDAALEGTVNATGYSVRANLGVARSVRVFELNTILFPKSANAWDSLADAHRALGNRSKAKQLAERSRALAIERGLAPSGN